MVQCTKFVKMHHINQSAEEVDYRIVPGGSN